MASPSESSRSGCASRAWTTSTPARWSASSKAIPTRCRASTTCCVRTTIRWTCSAASSSSRTGPACTASCRWLPAESTPGRCISCCTTSAKTPCCSSAAAPLDTRWASQPERRRIAWRWRRWCWRATKAATSGAKARRFWRRPRATAHRCARRWTSGARSRSITRAPTRRISFRLRRRPPDTQRPKGATMRLTQGTFSFLPDLTDEQIRAQAEYCLGNGWAVSIEYTDDPHPRNTYWEMYGQPMFDVRDAAGVLSELRACRQTFPNHYLKLNAFDSSRGRESLRLSFIVGRPKKEPGFALERQEGAGRTVHYTTRAYATDRPEGEPY